MKIKFYINFASSVNGWNVNVNETRRLIVLGLILYIKVKRYSPFKKIIT